MNLIINTTVLNATGVFQVALSFIEECRNFPEHTYHVFLCKSLSAQLDKDSFPSNFTFYDFSDSPVKLRKRRKILQKLKFLEQKINPDVVFTVFGPAYWKTRKPHVVGFALPHSIYPELVFFERISFPERLNWRIRRFVQKYFFKQNVSAYITETNDASERLSDYLKVKREKVFTVPNTYNSYFIAPEIKEKSVFLHPRSEDEFRFLTLASYHKHKNLEVLNEVIPLLKKRGFGNVKFVITIDKSHYQTVISDSVRGNIVNVGKINIKDCPQLYAECDALFLPSLLECFSANYPEAMKMQKPVLTSNLSFAKDVCQEAAIYFNPLDAEDIVEKIQNIISDKTLQLQLIEKGSLQLMKFPSAKERARRFLEICEEVRR